MPIQHAVLALLADGESYGYELRSEFLESVGPQWGDLNIGHLYQVLERLVRDGLVTKREVVQERRPDKVMFQLTAAGNDELTEWLTTASVRQTGYRDDVFLKLFAASRLGAKQLRLVLKTQRQAYLGELSSLQALRAEHRREPLVDLLVEAAILDTEAKLRVLELAESRQALLLRQARAARPASDEAPTAQRRARSAG